MRRLSVLLGVAVLLLFGTVAAVASPADEHDQPFPKHPHVLVLGVQFDAEGNPISVKKCVDLAANRALPLNAHHVHVHFGRAGEALASHNNFVVPTAPFGDLPWTDCASLLASVGL